MPTLRVDPEAVLHGRHALERAGGVTRNGGTRLSRATTTTNAEFGPLPELDIGGSENDFEESVRTGGRDERVGKPD